jgi:hypothetical protein
MRSTLSVNTICDEISRNVRNSDIQLKGDKYSNQLLNVNQSAAELLEYLQVDYPPQNLETLSTELCEDHWKVRNDLLISNIMTENPEIWD